MSADILLSKIKTLNECLWGNLLTNRELENWLDNFDSENEKLAALHLLSHYMYFGVKEIRNLLKELFLELFYYPQVRAFRREHQDTLISTEIDEFANALFLSTKIYGIGNPSESGQHLLYYLRQELALPVTLFDNTHRIFSRDGQSRLIIRDNSIGHYVFVDDFCGSGQQAIQYSRDIVDDIKRLSPDSKVYYLVLFATNEGLRNIRANAKFDVVDSVMELDKSYKVFEDDRYFIETVEGVSRDDCYRTALDHGKVLLPSHPLGYRNGQLLIGFFHNTPDNTLPIIWSKGVASRRWSPIFPRVPKLYD